MLRLSKNNVCYLVVVTSTLGVGRKIDTGCILTLDGYHKLVLAKLSTSGNDISAVTE